MKNSSETRGDTGGKFADPCWSTALLDATREVLLSAVDGQGAGLKKAATLEFSQLGASKRNRVITGVIRPKELDESNHKIAAGTKKIWLYEDQIRDPKALLYAHSYTSCNFCDSKMEMPKFGVEQQTVVGRTTNIEQSGIRVCPLCGWWTYGYEYWTREATSEQRLKARDIWAAAGCLKNLDLSDQSLPISEVRKFLVARYNRRFSLHPGLFEDVVASVFRDIGYEAFVTGRSGDGGIDVILHGSGGSVVGVQVKRYQNRISVEQIRELTGALVIKGITKGVFVTTSDFQRGADETAAASGLRGFRIELMNANRFYDALCIAQRNLYNSLDEPSRPFLAHIKPIQIFKVRYGSNAESRLKKERTVKKEELKKEVKGIWVPRIAKTR